MNEKPLDQGDFYLVLLFVVVPVCLFLFQWFNRGVELIASLAAGPNAWKFVIVVGGAAVLIGVFGLLTWWNAHIERLRTSIAKSDGEIYFGTTIQGDELHLTQEMRTRHTQLIGTTSSGKSESVILPWAIQDIRNGSGIIIVDGKADRSFLDKIYSHTLAAGRACDFRLFSLSNPQQSCTFNPLAAGTVQEVTERVFSSFQIENEYFESVQFRLFRDVIALIKEQNVVPTFEHVQFLLTSKESMAKWIEASRKPTLKEGLTAFNNLPARERDEKVSGLVSKLSHFCADEVSSLFNTHLPHLDLEQALSHKWICYFQVPTMYYQFLGSATGKLVLQCLQNAVAKRHNQGSKAVSFTSVFLDDFQDYIYEGFEGLLNKSRSAKIGMVFSHQALGDLDKVSPAFRNIVTTNTNIKIVMRNNDPETAEFFASSFGTKTSSKETERVSSGFLGRSKTGELSVRSAEEFLYHPNIIKSELATGEAIVSVPHCEGVETHRVRFTPFPDLKPVLLPTIPKGVIDVETLRDPPGRFSQNEINRL
jgi:type IV secretory pathway TraG/TraD family ATPase VirD4